MNEPICYIMVGLPALGKSTFIKNIAKLGDYWIYSTDMYIETVAEDHGTTYSEAFESNIKAAIDFNEQKLKTMLGLKRNIVWDQTNLGVGTRSKIINRMKSAGYKVNCICFMPPEPVWISDQMTWKTRLSSREGKIIPATVLSNMIESFVVPTLDEGFDTIEYYNMYGILIDLEERKD